MSSLLNSQLIQDLVAGIVFVGGIIIYAKGRIPQQTIKNLMASNESYVELDKARQKSIEALEQKIKEIVESHASERLELNKAISVLEGQIQVYKELPLRELAEGIKTVAATNDKILQELQKSSEIAAKVANEGGLLVKTKKGTPVTVKMEKK